MRLSVDSPEDAHVRRPARPRSIEVEWVTADFVRQPPVGAEKRHHVGYFLYSRIVDSYRGGLSLARVMGAAGRVGLGEAP